MRISVASYAFHGLVRKGMMDVFGYLETCKYRYHLQSADIWNGMLPTTDDEFLAKVREALDERELELANLCVDQAHIWEDDPAARERNYRNALAHLHAAEVLGAKTVRLDAGSRAEAWTEEQFDHIVARYQEYCVWAYERGIKVGPENHWGPEKYTQHLRALHDAVDHPAWGVLLHVGGWLGEDPEHGDAMAAPWTMHTHFSWQIIQECLAEKMSLLREAGYQGYWGVEHHTGENEYLETGIQVLRVADQLDRWRLTNS